MGRFHLHQEYSSTPIHHIILYYIVKIQENLPARNSNSESTVTSQLSRGPDLFRTLCDVLTISLALAHYALYFFPRKLYGAYFLLDKFFYTAHTNFKEISLRPSNSLIHQPTISQPYSILGPRAYQTPLLLYATAHLNTSFQVDHDKQLNQHHLSHAHALHHNR